MLSADLPTRVVGAGSPAVVQGPGWGPAVDYLERTLVPVLPSLRVLTYDVRNTGRARRCPAPGSQATARLAADLGRVTAAAGLSRFVLVGHSHGATVAAAFAALYPDRVAALVAVAPVLPGGPRGGRVELYRRALARATPDMAETLRLFRAGPGAVEHDRQLARWMRRVQGVYFHEPRHLEAFGRLLRHAPLPSADAWRGMPAAVEPWVPARLRTVAAPTLVVAGRHDLAAPVEQVEGLAARIPGCRTVVLERSGHHPWIEQGERFRAVVGEFLAARGLYSSPSLGRSDDG